MKEYILNTILIGLIFLFSCAKKEPIAPDLGVISEPVGFGNAFAVNNANPNFYNNDKIYFSATFSKQTHWLVTITGNTSGAVKTFEGNGTEISAFNAYWDGTANALPSFRAEVVTAVLSFPSAISASAPFPLSLNITIVKPKDLNYGNVLVTDFNVAKFGGSSANPNLFWPHDFVSTMAYNDIPHINPDGNPYCIMGPYGAWQANTNFVGHNSPYVDFLGISANSVGYPTYFPLIADPTKIYFNMMVYNNALPSNAWIQVTLSEDNLHPNPVLNDTIIGKTINIYPNWNTGWQLVTASYLDFKSSDTTITSNNPQKIRGITIVLLSNASQAILDAGTNPVSATFDHLIFTHYKPYQP
jgi:hypothetical protein